MRRTVTAVVVLACWRLVAVHAQEEPQPPETRPELDFLEYLGAWAEEDDEWLAIEEWRKDIEAEPGDEEPETERDDEDESE
jgi:hypothetical protein